MTEYNHTVLKTQATSFNPLLHEAFKLYNIFIKLWYHAYKIMTLSFILVSF